MQKIACEWGLQGIEAWREAASVFVIVDVLSFSTAVNVAVERGAVIIPFPYGDTASAASEADRHDAIVAMPRSAGGGQLSLSPASLRRVEAGTRIVLPSPNGSRLSLATGDTPTISGCLRNAQAVAQEAAAIGGDGTIVVIASGERWKDQSLRPAIEDWFGAGAVITALRGDVDAEAASAADAYLSTSKRLARLIRESRSGRELIESGYAEDVDIALELDASASVPIMRNGVYEDAKHAWNS
jgi:2-phosphosulfolactate phosphatase